MFERKKWWNEAYEFQKIELLTERIYNILWLFVLIHIIRSNFRVMLEVQQQNLGRLGQTVFRSGSNPSDLSLSCMFRAVPKKERNKKKESEKKNILKNVWKRNMHRLMEKRLMLTKNLVYPYAVPGSGIYVRWYCIRNRTACTGHWDPPKCVSYNTRIRPDNLSCTRSRCTSTAEALLSVL